MKLSIFAFLIFLSIFFAINAFTSCKSVKSNTPQDLTMTILLKKKKEATYIEENYADFRPSDIKKSNRTLNQYRVKFNCTKEAKEQLFKKLKSDSMVVEFNISSDTKIQSSKSQKSSKATPKY